MALEAGKIQTSHLASDHQDAISDHIPGTEILIIHESHGTYRDELILIPKPHNDPHDPLVSHSTFPNCYDARRCELIWKPMILY